MTPAQALIVFGVLTAAGLVGLILDIRHSNKERNEAKLRHGTERLMADASKTRRRPF